MRLRAIALLLAGPFLASAQYYRVNTIAGFGTYGGDGGQATAAFLGPGALAVDALGNVYISDPPNYRIRAINTTGVISTLVGRGFSAYFGEGTVASEAGMSTAGDLATDANNNVFFADTDNKRIREVTAAGVIKTVAGLGTCGVVSAGMVATQAPLCDVEGVATDVSGRVYFGSNSQIWQVAANGTLTLIAGTGGTGDTGDNGLATAAEIGDPSSMAIDRNGDLYFADVYNFVIRKVRATDNRIETVTTISDTSASTIDLAVDSSDTLYYVTGTMQVFKLALGSGVVVANMPDGNTVDYIAVDPSSGVLYVTSLFTRRVFKINGSNILPFAGAYPLGVDPLPETALSARLQLNSILAGLAVDAAGNVYFPELDNNLVQRIDKLTPGGVLSMLPTPLKLPTSGNFTAHAVAVGPGGMIYFSTFSQVYRLEANNALTLVAGSPSFSAPLGDGGAATEAKLQSASSLAFDQDGNLYIADPFGSRVRKVSPSNIISTFAGNGVAASSGDGGLAANASVATPVDVKVDTHGNVFIADLTGQVVRKVDRSGIISTVAGSGKSGTKGDGGPALKAEFSGVAAIAVDPAGRLFIADRNQSAATFIPVRDNNRIRMVDTNGNISTVYGTTAGYNGENVLSSVSASGGPVALASDSQGTIYIEDADSERIRELTPTNSPVQITFVQTSGGPPDIAQNDFIEIYGANLAPDSVGAGTDWSSAPEFLSGRMPNQLAGVSVMVNGKPAFVYFVSKSQVNVLTPLDSATGPVTIVVTNGANSSPAFTVNLRPVAPSFLRFGGSNYVVAQHADYSLLGPSTLGTAFTPAKPGETILLYAVGFGLPNTPVTNGSSTQSGILPALPDVKIGGLHADVYAAIIIPGLTQMNVTVPAGAPSTDNEIVVSYGGATTPSGEYIAVKAP